MVLFVGMKKWLIITIVTVLILSILGFIGWRLVVGQAEKPARTVEATRQTVVKDIAFTGSVESRQSSDVSFELSGVVKSLYVEVGDTVQKGQKLALLDPQSVELELAKAHADKASTASVEYISWQKANEDSKNTTAENAKILEQRKQVVRDAKTALDQSNEVFNKKSEESGDDSSTTLATYSTVLANKAAYNSAKTALDTALKTVAKANTSAKRAADIAYAQYLSALQAAPGDTGLSSLGAMENLAKVKAAKSIVRAPFTGVVTKKDIEVGELAGIGKSILTIETIDTLQISADVPETDAFALAENMDASVTFDAFSSEESAPAHVREISPAAIVIEGVPTFHVVLELNALNAKLRSGITANVTVHAAKREGVISIPRRAIITKSEKQFVRKQRKDQDALESEITTGLVGSDGLVEVTSGINEGDVLVTP